MIEHFYNQLAPYYKWLHGDWVESTFRHAAILNDVIHEFFGSSVHTVLDAACGIGTQSIGLARLGYAVMASDISGTEIDQARRDALQQGLSIQFCIADMRQLWNIHQQQFDVVIACDNAVPHLLSDAEIIEAFTQMYRCLVPGGGCIISVRDYGQMERVGRRIYPRGVRETDAGRMILFDVWEFDGDYYDITMYIVEDDGKPTVQTHVIRGGRYYCVSIETLERLFTQVGFKKVKIVRDRYFQPLIIATKE